MRAPLSTSSTSRSWLGSSLLVGLSALAAGCVVRAQPQPVYYGNDPNYAQPAPGYQPAPEYAPAPPAPAVEVDATVYPSTAPPPPVAEYRPPMPGYGYLWVDGYWDWNGYDWAWSNGYWQPNRPGYVFIGPRYIYEGGRPIYYRGYWQGSNGYRDYSYRAQPQPGWRGTPTAAPAGGWRSTPPAAAGATWRASPPPPSGIGGAPGRRRPRRPRRRVPVGAARRRRPRRRPRPQVVGAAPRRPPRPLRRGQGR